MDRFFLFEYNFCYPRGGMNDFVASFTTRLEAITKAKECLKDFEYCQIYDSRDHLIFKLKEDDLDDWLPKELECLDSFDNWKKLE